MSGRIVIAGGSGFIGNFLQERLAADGYDVVVLTRFPHDSDGVVRDRGWDGQTLGDWTSELNGARALINLSGRSVNCRYNERNRREILESRVKSTRVLGEAVAHSRESATGLAQRQHSHDLQAHVRPGDGRGHWRYRGDPGSEGHLLDPGRARIHCHFARIPQVTSGLYFNLRIDNYIQRNRSVRTCPKFMQTLDDLIYRELEKIARRRGITI